MRCTSGGSGATALRLACSARITSCTSGKIVGMGRALDNDVLSSAARDDHLARLLEPPDDAHHALLRLFHLLQLHRPHELHILAQHVPRALRHVLEYARL